MKFNILLLLIILCICLTSAIKLPDATSRSLFTKFLTKFKKKYSVGELANRYLNFVSTVEYILKFNKRGFKIGANKYADLSLKEFVKRKGGAKSSKNLSRNAKRKKLEKPSLIENKSVNSTKTIDWTSHFQPIQSQGSCGGCYAFSAAAVLEAYNSILNQSSIKFSEQEIIDCEKSEAQGCEGGFMDAGYYYASNKGLCSFSDYGPYSQKRGECNASCSKQFKLKDYNLISEEQIIEELLMKGPVSVGINIEHDDIRLYESGIIDIPECSKVIDHAVALVGMGEENGVKYWKIRNSWGPDWGEKGYFRIVRGKSMCGVHQEIVYPIFK